MELESPLRKANVEEGKVRVGAHAPRGFWEELLDLCSGCGGRKPLMSSHKLDVSRGNLYSRLSQSEIRLPKDHTTWATVPQRSQEILQVPTSCASLWLSL